MPPIRWDNINGANLSEAGRPLESAQRSFLGAFDTLGNTLKESQNINEANWQNTKANNTTAYLDQVAAFRSPEALRAAQESGQLDQLRQSFGNQVDANAIRGAADTRTAALQQQAQQEIAYKNLMTDTATAGLVDKFKLAAINGDKEAMAAMEAEYAAKGGRDLAGLASYKDQREQLGVTRGRDTTTFDNQVRRATDDHNTSVKGLSVSDANIKHMANQDAAALIRANMDKEQTSFLREDRQALRATQSIKANKDSLDAAYENLIKNSPLDKGTINTAQGKEELMKGLKAMGVTNQSQIDDLLYNLSKRFSKGALTGVDAKNNPVLADVPVSVVLDAFAQGTENPLSFLTPGWSRRGDDASNIIEKRMLGDKALKESIAAVEEANIRRRNPVTVQELRQSLSDARSSRSTEAPPARPKAGDEMTAADGKSKLVWVNGSGWTPKNYKPN